MLHRINIYYFIIYLFLTINYFILKLVILIKKGILLKNLVSSKLCQNITCFTTCFTTFTTYFITRFTKTLNQFVFLFFYLSRTNGNFKTCMSV